VSVRNNFTVELQAVTLQIAVPGVNPFFAWKDMLTPHRDEFFMILVYFGVSFIKDAALYAP
jgi:hypothetical protein